MNPPSLSFKDFYLTEAAPQCQSSSNCTLSDVFVGRTKDSLDRVDAELVIPEVIAIFGPFVKFTTVDENNKAVRLASYFVAS